MENILIILLVLVIGIHAVWLGSRKRFLLFDPLNTFWAGVIVVYVVQPLKFSEQFSLWHEYGILETTLLWIVFAIIFVIAGYEANIGRQLSKNVFSLPVKLDYHKLRILAIIFIVVGVSGFAYMAFSAGGVGAWLNMSRGGSYYELSGYILQMQHFLLLGVALLLFSVEMARGQIFSRLLIWTFAAMVLLWYFYLGTRSRTIGMVLIMLMSYYLPKKKNPNFLFIIPVFILVFVAVNFQADYRKYFYNLSFNADAFDVRSAVLESLPFSVAGNESGTGTGYVSPATEFNVVMSVVELVPSVVPFNYGYPFLELLTRPIPRSLWPDKIYPHAEAMTPILDKGNLSYSFVPGVRKPLLMGPAFTFVGFWYAAFGAIGLMLGGYITGILLRFIRSIYDRSGGGDGDVIIFSNLSMIGFLEASSTPLYWLYSLPFVIIPLVIAVRRLGVKYPMRSSARL